MLPNVEMKIMKDSFLPITFFFVTYFYKIKRKNRLQEKGKRNDFEIKRIERTF